MKKFFRKIYRMTPSRRYIGQMFEEIALLKNRVQFLEDSNLDMQTDLQLDNALLDMYFPSYNSKGSPTFYDLPQLIDENYSLEKCFDGLRKIAPDALEIYIELMDNNIRCYEGFPLHSCAVGGHKEAGRFRKFIHRYLNGYVLDVGCGPQPVPSYLEGYDNEKIVGLDPIPSEHPFQFVQGISEYIPFGDDSFECVIFSTSLDHIFLPNKVWEEVDRVLRTGGVLLIFTSFDENAPAYNPLDKNFKPYDQYHMFHYRKKQLESELDTRFKKVDYFKTNLNSHFYAYQKQK